MDERAPSSDVTAVTRRLGLSNDRSTVVQQVFNDFFTLDGDRYLHARIEADIQAYHRQIEGASRAGKASAAARKANKQAALERALNDRSTTVQPIRNYKQETRNNKTPVVLESIGKSDSVVGRATRLPADWVLPKAWGEWAMQERPQWAAGDIRNIAEVFKDHWIAASGRGASKLDWLATWRNWVRREPLVPKGGNSSAFKTAQQQRNDNNRASSEELIAEITRSKL